MMADRAARALGAERVADQELSFDLTIADTRLPSARPATPAMTAFMAGPIREASVKPPFASASSTMASSSSSSSSSGR